MRRAGKSSGKPNDLFKVKQRYKGDPEYEGPLSAYRTLVKSNRREGTYWTDRFRSARLSGDMSNIHDSVNRRIS
jgi:hypothetical protein